MARDIDFEFNVEGLTAINRNLTEMKALLQRIADEVAPEPETDETDPATDPDAGQGENTTTDPAADPDAGQGESNP